MVLMAKSPASAPPRVYDVKLMTTVPVLVRVSNWAALVVPTFCAGNVKAVVLGLNVSVADWPVPVRVTVCGEPLALSVMVRVAVRVPSCVGVKVMEIWQVLPDGNELLSALAQVLALMA